MPSSFRAFALWPQPSVARCKNLARQAFAALLASATRIQQKRATIHDNDASSTSQFHADVQKVLVTALTVNGGQLLESTTENGTLTTLRTFDAGKRVVSYRDEAGTTYGFTHDALGRLRRSTRGVPPSRRRRRRAPR